MAVLLAAGVLWAGNEFMKSQNENCDDSGACAVPTGNEVTGRAEMVNLPEAEWKKILTPEQFRILRDHGTERAFSHPLNDEKRPGVFVCAATGVPLFTSKDKFDSGTGWPSFTKPATEETVGEEVDLSYGMRRVEVYCRACGGHLGHVFEDGPEPTGLRYCINGTALEFVPAESAQEVDDQVAKQMEAAEERIRELLPDPGKA